MIVKTTEKAVTEILTIMFIDMVGYTSKTSKLKREEFNNLHNFFDSLAIPIFTKYEGDIVKKMGDAFLVTFKSPTNAVLCGMELQNTFYQYNKENKYKINIRVVVHTGEVLIRDNDIYGDAVNTTARIECITEANKIVFSEEVFSLMNKNEIPYVHLGLRRLRGLKRPVRLFRVKTREEREMDKYKMKEELKRKSRNKAKNTILNILFLIILVFVIWFGVMYLLNTFQ